MHTVHTNTFYHMRIQYNVILFCIIDKFIINGQFFNNVQILQKFVFACCFVNDFLISGNNYCGRVPRTLLYLIDMNIFFVFLRQYLFFPLPQDISGKTMQCREGLLHSWKFFKTLSLYGNPYCDTSLFRLSQSHSITFFLIQSLFSFFCWRSCFSPDCNNHFCQKTVSRYLLHQRQALQNYILYAKI